jgi:hypothetical protein
VRDRLQKLPAAAEFAGPVSLEKLARTEAALGTKLPPSYRLFLELFGACRLNGIEVAGIDPAHSDETEPPYWTDVVSATEALWRVQIPHELVFLADDGGDYKFYLDTSVRDASGECPVIVLGPGMDGETIAADFVRFLDRAASGEDLFTGPPWT